MRTSGERDFRFGLKLKITLEELTNPSQRPQCPSLSPDFLLVEPILFVDWLNFWSGSLPEGLKFALGMAQWNPD